MTAVSCSFDVDLFPGEYVVGPVDCRVEGFEPGVAEDDSVSSDVGYKEAEFGCLGSFPDP